MRSRLFVALGVSLLALVAPPRLDAKQQSRFVTAPMRTAALANAQTLPWVREQQERAVSAAKAWVERSDDELWAMVPAQELPRTIYTNEGVIYKGQSPACPNCGDAAPAKYGRSWWSLSLDKPWKIRCKQCGEVYPKNDFGAFYKTALDEHGMFRRKLGDRSLLFHADHPDPDDPLHALYVDDGYGMFDPQGKRHDVIAYYCQHAALAVRPRRGRRPGPRLHAHRRPPLRPQGGRPLGPHRRRLSRNGLSAVAQAGLPAQPGRQRARPDRRLHLGNTRPPTHGPCLRRHLRRQSKTTPTWSPSRPPRQKRTNLAIRTASRPSAGTSRITCSSKRSSRARTAASPATRA